MEKLNLILLPKINLVEYSESHFRPLDDRFKEERSKDLKKLREISFIFGRN